VGIENFVVISMLLKPSHNKDSCQGNHARSDGLMLTATTTTVLDIVINPSLIGFTTLTISTLGMGAIFFRREFSGLFNVITKFSKRYKITSPALTILGASPRKIYRCSNFC
jgi:hypothetical protein